MTTAKEIKESILDDVFYRLSSLDHVAYILGKQSVALNNKKEWDISEEISEQTCILVTQIDTIRNLVKKL